jgi:hypothetical protein
MGMTRRRGLVAGVRALAARRHGPVVEAAIGVGALLAYNLAKARTGGSIDEGIRNARRIVALEKRLGVFVEPGGLRGKGRNGGDTKCCRAVFDEFVLRLFGFCQSTSSSRI